MERKELKKRGQNRGRSRGDIYLICCEDEKSSRYYFLGLKEKLKRTKNIQVPKNKENDPVKIVQHAIREKSSEELGRNDKIWCVFDVDENTNDKLNEANKLAKDNNITCILSNPSFEIWYLLHYIYTTKPLSNEELEKDLKKHLPNYKKNDHTIFNQVYDLTETAINNARQLKTFHEDESKQIYCSESNPSTMVYQLVEELQKNIS